MAGRRRDPRLHPTRELASLDYDTGNTPETKVVLLGIKAEGDDRLTLLHGLQNGQTRELVREIKRPPPAARD